MTQFTIALAGNPNCGKSTLFNELTGARQKVGNWPGVTVECKTGHYHFDEHLINVVDLPGIYQLSYSDHSQAIDEKIACDFILDNQADVIINIIDASHLERHLYLTLQLLTMHVPTIVAVNMLDVAERRKMQLNLKKLQSRLGCPVVGLVANKGIGIEKLKTTIVNLRRQKPSKESPIHYAENLHSAILELEKPIQCEIPTLAFCSEWVAQQLLQDNDYAKRIKPHIRELALTLKSRLEVEMSEEMDIVFADVLYTTANKIKNQVLKEDAFAPTLTQRLDKIILNRYLGIPIFLLVMYCMFLFAISLGGAFQDFFDIGSDAIFVQGTSEILNYFKFPSGLVTLLADGFGRGINTTLTFIPVLAAMFFFLAMLENSGYMARASFVIDRFMRTVGLPGKSFVPMIVGFGCNVPAILAARTLENARDRTLTILMSPFMSCGARLTIFAVFAAAFFPHYGQNIVFALYLIGIVAAIFTGFILRKTLLKGEITPLVMELPSYHVPSLWGLLLQTWLRLKSFIFRAGKLIIPICMLIGLLNAINVDGSVNSQNSNSASLLSSLGRIVTPVLKPMGVREDNWPATVGIVTGVLAKEVVIATLNTLYSQEIDLAPRANRTPTISTNLKAALRSIPDNLYALKKSLFNPFKATAPENTLNHHVYGVMYERFNGQAGAFAYLLFVLLYFPCVSATAVMVKELNRRWTLFSVIWSTGLAYGVATTFYQLVTFKYHPQQSLFWIGGMLILFGCTLTYMRRCTTNIKGGDYVTYQT